MEDNQPSGRSENVLSLTYAQVIETITRLGHDIPCSTCGGPNWNLASHNGKPNIVNLPLASASGLAHWAFYLTCKKCGAAKFIDASHIVSEASQGSEQN
jgi:hypothetical protein